MSANSPREFDLSPLSESNLDQAALVFSAAFKGPPWNENWSIPASTQRLREVIQTPGFVGVVLTNRSDGKVVALGAGFFETWFNGRNFQIKELCVDPSLHGQGLGHRVLNEVMEQAFRQGAIKIHLYTVPRSPAEELYLNNGFTANDEVAMELLRPTARGQMNDGGR